MHYEVDGVEEEEVPFIVDDTNTFFNPKAGLTYEFSEASQPYFSYARANREPNRTDYENGDPEPDSLTISNSAGDLLQKSLFSTPISTTWITKTSWS